MLWIINFFVTQQSTSHSSTCTHRFIYGSSSVRYFFENSNQLNHCSAFLWPLTQKVFFFVLIPGVSANFEPYFHKAIQKLSVLGMRPDNHYIQQILLVDCLGSKTEEIFALSVAKMYALLTLPYYLQLVPTQEVSACKLETAQKEAVHQAFLMLDLEGSCGFETINSKPQLLLVRLFNHIQ